MGSSDRALVEISSWCEAASSAAQSGRLARVTGWRSASSGCREEPDSKPDRIAKTDG
jgi:hypothetical protein